MTIKKLAILGLSAVMATCLFTGCSAKPVSTSSKAASKPTVATTDLADIKEKGTLVIGMTEYKPMNFKDAKTKEWTGFDTEFAQAVAKELGVKAEFTIIDWDNRFIELDSKSIDCIWNGMTITEDTELNTSVSNPYVENAQVVVMKSSELSKYSDIKNMSALKFAAESGSAGEAALAENNMKNVTGVIAQSDALMEVSSGSVDACVIDITMATAMTGANTSYSNLGYTVKLASEEYGIGFRKNADTKNEVNKIMAKFMADGTLDKLAKKYSLTLVK